MALTRKFLSALGIEADKIDEIITAHSETVDALKSERDDYKANADKLPEVQKELDKLKKEAAKNSGDDYAALKKEFEEYKADVAKKEAHAAKETAYRDLLKDAGIAEKSLAKVLKYSDVDAVELDEDGKIKDAKSLIKSVREEWPEHIETVRTQGASTSTPPASTGKTRTKEEIMAIKDAHERQVAIAENHTLFGF